MTKYLEQKNKKPNGKCKMPFGFFDFLSIRLVISQWSETFGQTVSQNLIKLSIKRMF